MTIVPSRTTTELVEQALDDDQDAWNDLVARYTRLVWHVILGFGQLSADRGADVHQTAWLRLAEQLETIRDPERLGSWLATTARRECIRQVRLQEREVPTLDVDPGAAEESIELGLLETARDAAIWDAFRRLDESCRQLLRLLLAEPSFTYDEISEILGMKRGSIGPTRRRCLDALERDPGLAALEERR